MPTYVYKFVDSGETIEVQQAFTDDTLTEIAHPDSGQVMPVKKVFQPVGVTFRGSGFFKTDNRGKPTAGAKAEGKSDGSTSKSSDSPKSEKSSGDSSSSSASPPSKDSTTSSSTSSAKSD